MSSKKQDKKKGGKNNKDKDKEKQKMLEQQAKRQQEKQQAQKRSNPLFTLVHVLQSSGILDAYEYFLRAICKNGLPEANIFQFAAQQILKYQKKMKLKDAKREELNKSPPAYDRQRKGSIETSAHKQTGEKTKPNLLPFKGDTKEEALKALKK